MGVRALAVAAVLATGCAELLEIEADGRCGNKVVEPAEGEDCDVQALFPRARCGASGTPRACRYECNPGATCPPGWACGHDSICRVARGTFGAARVLTVPAPELAVTDVDGDRRPDIIAFSSDALEVRFGDAPGTFAGSRRLPLIETTMAPAMGDVTGDGIVDATVAQDDGIVFYVGREDRSLRAEVPATLDVPVPGILVPVRAGGPPTSERALALSLTSNNAVTAYVVGAASTDASQLEAASMNAQGGPVQTIAVGDLDGDLTTDELAIGVVGGTQIWIISLGCTGVGARAMCALTHQRTVLLPNGEDLGAGGTFFGDVDGDGATDLVADVHEPSNMPPGPGQPFPAGSIALGDGRGGFGLMRSEPALAQARCMRCPPELSAAILGVVDLNGDGRADFLGSAGVVLNNAGPPLALELVSSVEFWADADAGDFNRDGILDVAGTRGRMEGYDVLLGVGGGRFNGQSVGTKAPAARLTVGDFDGDLRDDVAMSEGAGNLVIRYANQSGVPSARVDMATFAGVAGLVTIRAETGTDSIDDLLVLPTVDSMSKATLLEGNGARRMLSDLGLGLQVAAIATARFVAGETAYAIVVGTGPAGATTLLARPPSAGGETKAIAIDPSCGFGAAQRMKLQAVDFDGDGVDHLFVVSRQEGPMGSGGSKVDIAELVQDRWMCRSLEPITEFDINGELFFTDLDADGWRDVIAVFSPAPMGRDTNAAGIAIWWGTGDPANPLERTAQIDRGDLGNDTPYELGVVELDLDDSAKLILATNDGFRIADVVARKLIRRPGHLDLPLGQQVIREVVGADANGDALPDMIIGTDTELFLFPQQSCTAQNEHNGLCSRRIEAAR